MSYRNRSRVLRNYDEAAVQNHHNWPFESNSPYMLAHVPAPSYGLHPTEPCSTSPALIAVILFFTLSKPLILEI
ncbi:hypothetical protein N7470_009012 [Penicillium chermesinum]|nr:hypothetical protein N7470_009012 [Penicillium chermesinum]